MSFRLRPLQVAVVLNAAACVGPGKLSDTARATSVFVPSAAHATPATTEKVLDIRDATRTYLSAGGSHSCAVLDSGAVKCWGFGGLLGLGDKRARGGKVHEMGDALGAVDLGKGRTGLAVTAGLFHSCALLATGAIKCWGDSLSGQLGLGDTKNRGNAPNDMGDTLPAVDLGAGRRAVAVSAGMQHTCALLATGAIKCWGDGAYGQLGLGAPENRGDDPNEMGDVLPAVDLGKGRTAVSVSAGGFHTCAILDTGTVKCWGNSANGQLGVADTRNRGAGPNEMGDALPTVDLGTGRTAVAVSAGGHHTCAILDTGAVKCWGQADYGQLGLGDRESRGDAPKEMGDALPAVDLGTGRTAVALSAGGAHTCVVLDTGTVKCWGINLSGPLGLGDENDRGDEPNEMGDSLPAVDLGAGRTALAVSAGGHHTCALLATGAVKCWGEGDDGQLGLGDKRARGTRPNEMGDALPAVDLGGRVAR